MRKVLTREELDSEIEKLLEERPNLGKPKRRRREDNKEKDLRRKVLRGYPFISEDIVIDILGFYDKERVESVRLMNIETLNLIGHKYLEGKSEEERKEEIVEELAIDCDKTRLRGFSSYNIETGKFEKTGEYLVYKKGINMEVVLFDREGKVVSVAGGVFDPIFLDEKVLEDGEYRFTEDIKEKLEDIFGRIEVNIDELSISWEDYDRLFELDIEGKYEEYRKALKMNKETNMYSKTIPIKKGDFVGKENELIKKMNANLKKNKRLEEGLERDIIELELEGEYYIYDYVW